MTFLLIWLALSLLVALGLHAAGGRRTRDPDDIWCVCRRPRCKRCNALRRELGGRQ